MNFKLTVTLLLLLSSNCLCSEQRVSSAAFETPAFLKPFIEYWEPTENWLNSRFMVIQSNIKKETLEEKIKEAQVVLLAETHNDELTLVETNIELINKFWKERNILLLEGFHPDNASINPTSRYPSLKKSIFKSIRSWDLAQSAESINLYTRLHTLLNGAECLPIYLFLAGNVNSESDQEFREACEEISPENKDLQNINLSQLSKEEQIEVVKALCTTALEKLKNIQEDINKIIYKEFLDRQIQMVKTINSNVQNSNKVWLIAGEAHCRFVSSHGAAGVSYLYEALEQRNIPYITLKYRSSVGDPPSREEALDLLNDISLISLREREIELQARSVELFWQEKLLEECKDNYSKSCIFLCISKGLEEFQSEGFDINKDQDLSDFLLFAIPQMLKAI